MLAGVVLRLVGHPSSMTGLAGGSVLYRPRTTGMDMTEQAVESSSAGRLRRRSPEEVEGLQSVHLRPGGEVTVLNVSNGGMLVQTENHTKPGSTVRVIIVTTDAKHEAKAKIVRSEITTVGGSGIQYLLGLAFDEALDLIDDGDAAPGDAPAPRWTCSLQTTSRSAYRSRVLRIAGEDGAGPAAVFLFRSGSLHGRWCNGQDTRATDSTTGTAGRYAQGRPRAPAGWRA